MQYMESLASTVENDIGGVKLTDAFLLADGIYPSYAYLMKSFTHPGTQKEQHFSKHKEGCRKDVGRAFGRMLSKWHILSCAARFWLIENVRSLENLASMLPVA